MTAQRSTLLAAVLCTVALALGACDKKTDDAKPSTATGGSATAPSPASAASR